MEIIAKFYNSIASILDDDTIQNNSNNSEISDISEIIALLFSRMRVITRLFLLGSRALCPAPVMTHYNTIMRVRTLLFRTKNGRSLYTIMPWFLFLR